LGSNIDPEINIVDGGKLLSEIFQEINFSSIWESPAVGSSGPDYLNSAALIQTDLPLESIKAKIIIPIENELGRIRSNDKYMDRTIDLDVLVYETSIIDPEVWTLAHLAVPASELMPALYNKATGKSLQETAAALLNTIEITLRSDLQHI
jgi:2-amino-4-hydroxy-6-hydroxymethyldihydropteridine diphosphokinase